MTRWMRRLVNVFRTEQLERELDAELESHLGLETDRNLRAGMPPAEARRVAHARLGGVEQVKERYREARPFRWVGTTWLDVKLGLRMLRKSWGLTLVGGLAMTVVIGIALVVFISSQVLRGGTLPLDEGERVVGIWPLTSLHDFERWSDALRSVEDIGAFQTIERGLATANSPAEPVFVAEMTASGFRLARVPPLLGRPLVEADERVGAIPVVVIGYDVWQSRFQADPAVVGQYVRLGGTDHTVVGVMPEDFGFPVNHRLWTPLRSDPSDDVRDRGPDVFVFARLAPGVTLEGAQAELTTIGPTPAAFSDASERLQPRPRFLPYRVARVPPLSLFQQFFRSLLTLVLIPPCANMAILIYARTVTRQEEFAVRYALGASRGRLVGQLFVEALVLAAGAAGVALVLVRLYMNLVSNANGIQPFWYDLAFSYRTVLFAAGLAVIVALFVGVVPALQATGRLMQPGLRALGSRTGLQLGATWTALVVAQIGFSVAALPLFSEWSWGMLRPGVLGPEFAAEEFLTARLLMEGETPAGAEAEAGQRQFASRFGAFQSELVRRLEAEPGVLAATVSAAVPGVEPSARVEVDGVSESRVVLFNRVDNAFFNVFDVPLLIGRRFDTGDLGPALTAVIVNRKFVQDYLGDGNPLGRRVRYLGAQGGSASEPGPWHEIVGVVDDLPANTNTLRMYHPMAPGQTHPVSLALRVGPTAPRVAGRLLDMTTALDPTLRVEEILALDEIYRKRAQIPLQVVTIVGAITLSVLLLSAAGLYALMSFTVTQRRREIGIRSALGAQPRRLLAGIFRRALRQVATGAVVGVLAALYLDSRLPIEELGGWNIPGIVPVAAAFMIGVGLLAAAGPARRGLRIEPTEALRDG